MRPRRCWLLDSGPSDYQPEFCAGKLRCSSEWCISGTWQIYLQYVCICGKTAGSIASGSIPSGTDWKSGTGVVGIPHRRTCFLCNVRNFHGAYLTGKSSLKLAKKLKKRLTQVTVYHIIINCDNARKYLIQCPGKMFLTYKSYKTLNFNRRYTYEQFHG